MDEIGTTVVADFDKDERRPGVPELVIQQQGCVESVRLSGVQLLGRPTEGVVPDIPISAPFVSRRHGLFKVQDGQVIYTALGSLNGIYLNGRRMEDGERAELRDGDILTIYKGGAQESYTDVSMECAFSPYRQKNWHEIIRAQYDALTGLLTRKAFTGWFNIARLSSGSGLCLCLIDVDRFKSINDTYGHEGGDAALKALADTLKTVLWRDGRVGRWGGDEFVAAIFADPDEMARRMEAVRTQISRTRIHGAFNITISAGIADVRQLGRNAALNDIISAADAAMYQAKATGKNRIARF